MQVMRVGELQAKADLVEALREFLISIIPLITTSEGCKSCQLLQSQDEPTTFMMIEVWDSVEAHQASVHNIPPEKLTEIRPLLAAPPSGRYFDRIAEG